MLKTVYVLPTADCETARSTLASHALQMSPSGPNDYAESEIAIRGYAEVVAAYGYPLTLFVHPEVAIHNRSLLLDLQAEGACLGLHIHPYKLIDAAYREDVGAYPAPVQREMMVKAMDVWETALGARPRYFRGGFFSANDGTFAVLDELGFQGSSLSNPGRILPEHCSVWAGAEPYPHRAHLAFRQRRGTSDLIEVPIAVDYERPMTKGAAGEIGYEWPYVPARYNHRAIITHIVERFVQDDASFPVIVLDTHNDQDYTDPDHPARHNLELIFDTIQSVCAQNQLQAEGITLDALCDLVRAAA